MVSDDHQFIFSDSPGPIVRFRITITHACCAVVTLGLPDYITSCIAALAANGFKLDL